MTRILLVDDENSILNLLMEILRPEGHSVVPTSSGEEALKALAVMPFDLVITDYEMPRMNGIELIEEIRDADLNMPIIIMTEDPDATKYHGADALLVKPIGLVVLLARVDNLLKAKAKA